MGGKVESVYMTVKFTMTGSKLKDFVMIWSGEVVDWVVRLFIFIFSKQKRSFDI